MISSWTTDRPPGFGDQDIRALLRKGDTMVRQAYKSVLDAAREAEKRLGKVNRQFKKKG